MRRLLLSVFFAAVSWGHGPAFPSLPVCPAPTPTGVVFGIEDQRADILFGNNGLPEALQIPVKSTGPQQ